MSKRLYVGNLPFSTTNDELKELFSAHGEVTSANVITDRDTGRSRGFGFVTFDDGEAASRAISEMDGQDLDGRTIKVNEAQDRPRGGGGGGRGGHRGGGGGGNRW